MMWNSVLIAIGGYPSLVDDKSLLNFQVINTFQLVSNEIITEKVE